MANVINRKWEISDDQLLLKSKGERFYPSADEVYRSIIEQKIVFSDVPPGPPANLKKLSFSKYPAQLLIEVDYNPSEGDTGLFCLIIASVKGKEVLMDTLRARKTDHIVIDGKWYPFALGAVKEILRLFDNAGINDAGHVSFRQFMYLKQTAQENELIRDRTAGQIVHPGITKNPGEDALRLFEGSLYPYQKDGWHWLSFICQEELGGILADEMGLGKTVQIITALAKPERQSVVPSLIVATSTLLENWRREIAKFAPSLKVCIHQGPERTGLPASLQTNDAVISSYDTIVRDGALFGMIDWKIIVLDEAQAIKNPETRRASAVKNLKKNVGIAVTGTPVENRLRDLWSIVDFVLPNYLGTQQDFENRFEESTEGGKAIEPIVSPIMLRRRVKDVAQDLPERIEIPQVLLLNEKEIVEYEHVRKGILEEYGMSASLVSLAKLRMFCAHPWLLEDRQPGNGDPAEFGKFGRMLEIIEEIFDNEEKVLVFTSYNRMSDIIVKEALDRFEVYADVIDGRTPISERQDNVDRFSSETGPALLALNPRAAGTGLNITAANHVIHYNLEWNPAIEDQASARAHRRGQARPVTIHRLYIAGTVEEAIDQRLERKRQLIDAAIVGVAGKEEEYDDILRALQITPAGSTV